MAMEPQYDAITGGTVLRLPALQSPNFVTGVSGWIIRQDGTVEFNNGTFRGSITSGTNPGQHIVINNTVTGDAVDVYDSGNNLVASIAADGTINTITPPLRDTATLQNNGLFFRDQGLLPSTQASVTGGSRSTGSAVLISSGASTGTSSESQLEAFDSTAAPGGKAFLSATQRGSGGGLGKTGSVVQTDTNTTVNNLVHAAVVTVVTDASGNANFAHGCAFTPVVGFLSCIFTGGGVGFYEYGWFSNPFTSTNANAHFNDSVGNPMVNKTMDVCVLFFG